MLPAAGGRGGGGLGALLGAGAEEPQWGAGLGTPRPPPHLLRLGKIDEAALGAGPPRLGKPITAEVFYHCHGSRGGSREFAALKRR